jgi:CHAT domain-containing protein/tetratricopeptide (TPR) repeat protein
MDRGEFVEPEEYLDVAVTEWLPRRWEDPRYERVLTGLANRFVEQHHDPWLRDVLAAKRSEAMERGLKALAEAVKANLSDESNDALSHSADAGRKSRSISPAAALRADFERNYALRRALRMTKCPPDLLTLEHEATRMSYTWIAGQAVIEATTCRGQTGDSGAALREMNRALDLAHKSGYPRLELRAVGMLGAAQADSGNMLPVWQHGVAALGRFWNGPFPSNRAHQIYYDLFLSARSLGLRQTAFVMERAAVNANAATGLRRMEAMNRAQLAQLAVEAGRPEDARAEFDHASSILQALPPGDSSIEYRSLAEVNRAQAELAMGEPNIARAHLEPILPELRRIPEITIQIRVEQLLGDSEWYTGQHDEAEAAYRRAIQFAEQRLRTVHRSRERAELMRDAAPAYRGLVGALWLRGDPQEALRVWEWFRAAERPEVRSEPDLDRRRRELRRESFLAYALTPAGLVGWLFNDQGILSERLSVKPEKLEIAGQRFLRECADPASDRQTLEHDSRQLYDWLIAPFGTRLDHGRTLVIEPDGGVGAIPVQALKDEHSVYLGERYAITIASGLTDYQERARAGPVTSAMHALVVANPALGRDAAQSFPALPQSAREGRAVADLFPGSILLAAKRATLEELEKHRGDAELLHFAGHGFSNAGNGGLLLAPGDASDQGAGVLSGAAVAFQDWTRYRLAVLSACSAGTGENKGGVNPESLVRGLLWAGFARVIAARWSVGDESVPAMKEFYQELLNGNDPPSALQHTARRIRETSETNHPYYWAAFQNFGTR